MSISLDRIAALARKEWREIVRDRIFCSLAFVLPVVLMFVFGYGISQSVEHMPLVVVDYDGTPSSRAYADHYAHDEHFEFRGVVGSERQAEAMITHASAHVMLVVPAGFEHDVLSGRTAQVQTFVDGSSVMTQIPRALEQYLDAIHAAASSELQVSWLSRRLGVPPARAAVLLHPVRLDLRYLYNPELRSIWSVAPALIMFVLVFVAPMLMALGVVRDKETGAIYNIYASTITRGELLLGKLAPNLAIAGLNATVLWIIATGYFGAPFKGSLACFAVGTFAYIVCTTSLGLVLSLAVRTQQTALMIASITGVILGFQYSGFFAPVQSMSGFPWLLAHAFPPMYYLDVIEGTFLKGMGFRGLWRELFALAGFAALYLAISYALFHKRRRT